MYGKPKFYSSIEDFEREEIHPHTRIGWSIDDVYIDAEYRVKDDSYEDALKELNFSKR